MEHFKDNSGCSGPKKSEIFWNNSRKFQYVFAGECANKKCFTGLALLFKILLLHYYTDMSNTLFISWLSFVLSLQGKKMCKNIGVNWNNRISCTINLNMHLFQILKTLHVNVPSSISLN